MGRVRTKTIKRASKVLLEKHYQKLTSDFHINKRILSEVAKVPTKKIRNKIAGFATHLVKRIQKGPVKGISLKVQEQERERRLDWVPKESEIKLDRVTIDAETQNMLKARFGEDVVKKMEANLEIKATEAKRDRNQRRKGGDRKDRQDRPQRVKKEEGGNTETRQPRQKREPRQHREPREPREHREPRQARPPRQAKDGKQAPQRQERKRGNREGQQ